MTRKDENKQQKFGVQVKKVHVEGLKAKNNKD